MRSLIQSGFFHCAQQRVLVLLCQSHYLRDFGLRYFVIKNTAITLALGVHFKHHLRCARPIKSEYRFEDINDEFHRCVVVID